VIEDRAAFQGDVLLSKTLEAWAMDRPSASRGDLAPVQHSLDLPKTLELLLQREIRPLVR
jgi:hypothetical protein